jgi:YEATS family
VEQQPFEVIEGGWGEFEIGIQVRSLSDVLAVLRTQDVSEHGLLVQFWLLDWR